jgi:hypothetical protein
MRARGGKQAVGGLRVRGAIFDIPTKLRAPVTAMAGRGRRGSDDFQRRRFDAAFTRFQSESQWIEANRT